LVTDTIKDGTGDTEYSRHNFKLTTAQLLSFLYAAADHAKHLRKAGDVSCAKYIRQ